MANTVQEALVACGVNTINNVVSGQNNSDRMAIDMFGSIFETCIDKTFDDVDDEFLSYSSLTQVQGQIRMTPGTKRKVKGFVQWVKGQYHLGLDPAATPFPVDQTEG